MSWTTVVDLFMDEYLANSVVDKSDFGNHANLIGSATSQSGYVNFTDVDAQIEIPVQNESLTKFEGFRIQALVKPNPLIRRYNIAEGWMSFALVINPNGQLVGTVYDGQQWIGPDSGNTLIQPNVWSRVSFEYDGISLGKLTIDETVVGQREDMPLGMNQPQQVITLGHWPRGDHRYTLSGALGHVRIERRNYEDYWRDAMGIAFCKRKLSNAQLDAQREINYLLSTFSEKEVIELRNCAQSQSLRMRALLKEMRSWGGRERVRLNQLADLLLNAWCCVFDGNRLKFELERYFQEVGVNVSKEQKEKFLGAISEFFELSKMCYKRGYPYDRIRELFLVIFPELSNYQSDIQELIDQQ